MTARVRDIISNILANDPLALVVLFELTRLVLSSSLSGHAVGRAVFVKVSSESLVIGLSERRPAKRVLHVQ